MTVIVCTKQVTILELFDVVTFNIFTLLKVLTKSKVMTSENTRNLINNFVYHNILRN